MRQFDEIHERVQYLKAKLEILKNAENIALSKKSDVDESNYLDFIYEEQKIYMYALEQFSWLLKQQSGSFTKHLESEQELLDLQLKPLYPQVDTELRSNINILSWGGLGDALLLTPTLKALKRKFPNRSITLYYQRWHKNIFVNNPYIDRLKEASFKKSPVSWLLIILNVIKVNSNNYSWINKLRLQRKRVAYTIADFFDVNIAGDQMSLFLTNQEIEEAQKQIAHFKNPIAISKDAVSSQNKRWYDEKWEKLIREMPEFTFIQLGHAKDKLLQGAIDFRGKSIRESAAIIKICKSFVGVDSFFAHAAVSVNTPSVVLFGPTSDQIFGHTKSTTISKRLPCSPCAGKIKDSACPYSRECMASIKVEEVKTALYKNLAIREVQEYQPTIN